MLLFIWSFILMQNYTKAEENIQRAIAISESVRSVKPSDPELEVIRVSYQLYELLVIFSSIEFPNLLESIAFILFAHKNRI